MHRVQSQLTAEERNWAMAAHLSALIAVAGLPFGHVIGPLVVYLIKGHQSPFVAEHARASLNYQLTISLLGFGAILVGVAVFFAFALVGAHPAYSGSAATGIAFFGVWVLIAAIVLLAMLLSLIFIILGSVAASSGRPYSYPFAIRFVR